jgi:hypothetical protein
MSQDDLIKYISSLCELVVVCRDQCDIQIPDDPETTAKIQVDAYRRWNVYYGWAMGTLISYRQCSSIEDFAYDIMKARIQATLAPRVVGTVQAPIQQPRGVQLV